MGTHRHRQLCPHPTPDGSVTRYHLWPWPLTMSWYHLLVVVLSVLLVPVPLTPASSSDTQQRFILEPQNLTVVIGSKVTLPCRVKNLSGYLQWVQHSFGLGNLSGYPRYQMRPGGEEGDFSLEIVSASLEDEGKYECQVSGGNPPVLRSKGAWLTVIAPPEAPKILQGSSLETKEDDVITLECVSSGGKPSARITWIVADLGVLTEGVTHSEARINGSDLFTSRSVLKLTAKKHHHNTTFVCRVQHSAEQFARLAEIQLKVRFAPKVNVTVVGKNPFGWILEGSDIRVVCRVDANPSNVSYKWFIDGRQSLGTSNELFLRNVSRALHGASVLCQAVNELGKDEGSAKLNVSYGPSFRLEPLPVYSADDGSFVTMTCDADGRPAPDIRWLVIDEKSNHEMVVGTSPNLTLNVVSNTAGRYYCKAHVVGFPEITAKSAQVLINGKPEIFSIRTQLVPAGIMVECEAISLPKYDKVTWSRNGKELYADAAHDIKESGLFLTGIKSVLTIKGAPENITGMYSCSVTNAYGSVSVHIYLIPPNAEIFPFLAVVGVSGGCVVFVVVVVGIMVFRKCRTPSAKALKPLSFGETEGDQLCRQTSDISSNVSAMKITPQGSLMSRAMSEADSEPVVEVLPPAKSVHRPFTLTDNVKYATGNRVSSFAPQSVSQLDDHNSTYLHYDLISQDDMPFIRINDLQDVCPRGTIVHVPIDSLTSHDVNVGPSSSRCSSRTTTDSRIVSSLPHGMPCRRCSYESTQLPPPRSSSAVSTTSSGLRSTPTPPPFPRPLSNARGNEAAIQVGLVPNTTVQDAMPPSQTGTLRHGVVASLV